MGNFSRKNNYQINSNSIYWIKINNKSNNNNFNNKPNNNEFDLKSVNK